ncbi:MAG TPA: hypothetical protein VFJ96_04755, partial [Gemmatimonadaceae bacterium]|nr:hypothetical protein [Gemmatimonadaceae bacterium]
MSMHFTLRIDRRTSASQYSSHDPERSSTTSDAGDGQRPTRTAMFGVFGVAAWIVCAAAFAIAYHAHERTVYVWDFYNFPRKFDALVRLTHQGIAPVLRHVRLSLNSDYTDVPAVLLLPAGLIGGPGRAAYLAGVAAEYGAVAMIGMFMLFRSIVARSAEREQVLATSAALLVAALLPHFWLPILRGYPDVLGMGVLAILLALQVRRPMWERPLTHALGVGLAIAGLLLFRRWYAYFVIAWAVAVVGDLAYVMLRRRLDGAPWRAVRGLAASGLVAGAAAALVMYVALSPARIHAMATTSYRTLYAGYRSHGLGAVLAVDWAWLGAATALLALAGLVFARRYWHARAALVLAIYTVVGIGLFQHTQDFGMHHWYGVMPVLAVCVMTGVYGLITSCARASARVSMTAAVGLL